MSRTPRVPPGTTGDPDLQRALSAFAAAVVRLSSVDPVTTELVRVRCARAHDCRT